MDQPPEQPDPGARQEKARLRREVRAAVGRLTPDERRAASARICERLNGSDRVHRAACVMLFDALPDEPDVSPVAAAALARGKTVCYPRIDWDRRLLTPVAVDDLGFVRTSARHGVHEPEGGREIHPSEVDLVIVPGVAFDPTGARLGRGGGFYDRFLEALVERVESRGAVGVGVCFECQRVERVPREPHDVRVEAVVTEKGVFPGAA